jgi:hypothetical protein
MVQIRDLNQHSYLCGAFQGEGFQFEEFFVLSGCDVVEAVLRNIDIGDINFPAIQKMRQDHPVYRLVADDHDVVGVPV